MSEQNDGVVLAIDQGTTSTKALILDARLQVLSEASEEFPQYFPSPGWVEHDPEEIFDSVRRSVVRALREAEVDAGRIRAVGITNQRETTVVWDRESGKPVERAIVWQDRRTTELCDEMKRDGQESIFRQKTGLLLDPYFSGTKIRWILDNVSGARKLAEAGKLLFGTVDTYLTWRVTGGRSHVTDVSNASRTLMMDLEACAWDEELLGLLQIPRSLLATIQDNDRIFGETRDVDFLPDGVPVAALIGDQQSALFGQVAFEPGEAKCTYGTGAFLVMNTGDEIVPSKRGLLSTAAWRLGGSTRYALEGSSFVAGAIVQWLRDGLGLIQRSEDIEELASSVTSSEGVVLVPALAGLGAPHWDPRARGVISGITRGTTAGHLARAALEGIALTVHDLLKAMHQDVGKPIPELKVDGGAAQNDLLLQFQADVLGVDTVRPQITSTTALGAALQAGLTVGLYPSPGEIRKIWQEESRFHPRMKKRDVNEHVKRWENGVRQARMY
ncbi:MAG: glycerol kinase GlpK [Planctomycetota bacterium]|nr:glycerol kinase GlpK [Planctomycetota bacterium]